MTTNSKISDYITFPKSFENYRWYKPLLVILLTIIFSVLLGAIVALAFYGMFGKNFLFSIFRGGYEAFNSPIALLYTDLNIIVSIPALYLSSKIVKDRPFSSYSSSRGGWNFKLFFKALLLPLVLYIAFECLSVAINGSSGTFSLSILFILVLLISVPLQSIAEEYLFRGLIMQSLGSWFKIPILAIVIQSIIFMMLHGYNSIGLVETFVSGIIYGFFAWKTDGLEVCSAIHAVNNFSVGLFVMLGLRTSTSTPQLNDVAATIVFLVISSAIIYYVGKKTDWYGEISESSQ